MNGTNSKYGISEIRRADSGQEGSGRKAYWGREGVEVAEEGGPDCIFLPGNVSIFFSQLNNKFYSEPCMLQAICQFYSNKRRQSLCISGGQDGYCVINKEAE